MYEILLARERSFPMPIKRFLLRKHAVQTVEELRQVAVIAKRTGQPLSLNGIRAPFSIFLHDEVTGETTLQFSTENAETPPRSDRCEQKS